eukprot:TRINITY_DN9595_c0_g1_i1.p1 TRINITY_DN9595_c0_g1~~TRINITY_DN9595_c0_g1_i1.p1  ORF type:complete len:901 (-),score=127.82 TRINITY_DN9595_c0_g1_i1:74-2776(-)
MVRSFIELAFAALNGDDLSPDEVAAMHRHRDSLPFELDDIAPLPQHVKVALQDLAKDLRADFKGELAQVHLRLQTLERQLWHYEQDVQCMATGSGSSAYGMSCTPGAHVVGEPGAGDCVAIMHTERMQDGLRASTGSLQQASYPDVAKTLSEHTRAHDRVLAELVAHMAEATSKPLSSTLVDFYEINTGETNASKASVMMPQGRAAFAQHKQVIRPDELDLGDVLNVSESVWSCCLFLYSGWLGWFVFAASLMGMLISASLQLLFVYIVFFYMLDESPVSPERMDALVQFRNEVGHAVELASASTDESLIARICRNDWSLHTAATQFLLLERLTKFANGGPMLSTLAILCWILCIMKEVVEIEQFARAVIAIPSGPTRFVAGLPLATETQVQELVQVRTVVKLQNMNVLHKISTLALGVTPRLIIALMLGIVGVQFLATTVDMTELLLNTMSLVFILELDEFVFCCFAPRRARILLTSLQPLRLPQGLVERKSAAGITSFINVIVLGVIMTAIYFALLGNFFGLLDEAQQILCSGHLNFISALNPATGVVEAAASNVCEPGDQHYSWEVLEMAQPSIGSRHGWTPTADVLTAIRLGSEHGGFFRKSRSTSLNEPYPLPSAVFNKHDFDWVQQIPFRSRQDLSAVATCVDGYSAGTERELLRQVRKLSGNESASGCSDLRYLCGNLSSFSVRMLCPEMCACEDDWLETDSDMLSGPFASPFHGCPANCDQARRGAAWLRAPRWGTKHSAQNGARRCQDTSMAVWNDLGSTVRRQFATYLAGVFELVAASPPLHIIEDDDAGYGYANVSSSTLLVDAGAWDALLNGTALEFMLQGNWGLSKDHLHPRNLKGCPYLSSWELTYTLGFALCSASSTFSIRGICPVSCGCGNGAVHEQCPHTCLE